MPAPLAALAMEAPEVFVTLPPENNPIPSSTVAMRVPEFTIVPAPPWTITLSSPPVIELVLVTSPPWVRPTP